MPASPEESGVFTPGKIFEGKFCVQIPIGDVQKGDYIEFYRQGRRTRKVKGVVKTKKHTYVQIEQSKYNPFKNQRVDVKDIYSVWRPQRRKRAVKVVEVPHE